MPHFLSTTLTSIGIPVQLHAIWVIQSLCSKNGYRELTDFENEVIEQCLEQLECDIAIIEQDDDPVELMAWGLIYGPMTGTNLTDIMKEDLYLDDPIAPSLIIEFLSDMCTQLNAWKNLERHMFKTWESSGVITKFLLTCYQVTSATNAMDNRGHPHSLYENGLIDDPKKYIWDSELREFKPG